MKKNNWNSKGIVLGVIILIIITCSGTLLAKRSTIVSLEENIEAQYTANKSNYDQMVKSAKEMVQVTDMYAEDFERIYTSLIEGRYGENEVEQKLKTLFKLFQESNNNKDQQVYTTLQRELSANRKVFDNKQATISDKVREYNTYVRKHFITATVLNKEAKDMNKYIVTSKDTKDTFNSGESEAIELRGE